MVERYEEGDVGRVIAQYRDAMSRLESLVAEAGAFAARLERLGHGLSAHPERVIVGLPDEPLEDPSEWDIVPSHPLPSIERVSALTNEIRAVGGQVEELRQRLILTGHAGLVEQPNGFFH